MDGKTYELEGYYPALIDANTWAALQVASTQRFRRKGKGEIPGIITGMGICYCGYCGGAMTAQNLNTRPLKKDGTPQDGHRRLLCAKTRIGCEVGGSCSVAPVERALLAYCSDKFNLSALLEGGADPSAAAQTALTRARKEVLDLEKKLDRVNAALLADDGATPLSIIRLTREIEEKLEDARQTLRQAEGEVARATRKQTPQLASAWKALVKGALALDYETRMKTRQLVADTFERIVIYHQGVDPEGENRAPIDIVLVARGGAPRAIRIDRRTGELLEQEDGS